MVFTAAAFFETVGKKFKQEISLVVNAKKASTLPFNLKMLHDASPKSESTSPHLLLVPIPAWGKFLLEPRSLRPLTFGDKLGHIRPLCVLATRIIYERPDVFITMISAPMFLDKTIHEFENLAEGFGCEDKVWFMERIRYVFW